MIIPFRQFRTNDQQTLTNMVEECVRMTSRRSFIKATLEAGELEEEFIIREAARRAMDAGAEFLETESGQRSKRCEENHVRCILEEIRDHRMEAGLKVGPCKTLEECRTYLNMAAEVMGEDWITPDNFRIGGGLQLLDEAEAVLARAGAAA